MIDGEEKKLKLEEVTREVRQQLLMAKYEAPSMKDSTLNTLKLNAPLDKTQRDYLIELLSRKATKAGGKAHVDGIEAICAQQMNALVDLGYNPTKNTERGSGGNWAAKIVSDIVFEETGKFVSPVTIKNRWYRDFKGVRGFGEK